MTYYEVLVASHKYHGNKALTYSYSEQLDNGSVVIVPLQKQSVPGVVVRKVSKPAFSTKAILQVLETQPFPSELIQLSDWLCSYYPAPLGQLMTLFLPTTLVQKSRITSSGDVEKHISTTQPKLNTEQQVVFDAISASRERMHLLHGETGTGKTRLYIELIKHCQRLSKSSLLLTPEIGLTSQLAANIETAFPTSVVILHSNLTPAQRRDRWLAILNSRKPLIIIGPRSALFAPLKDVGIIILDEGHDTAYKQEQAPHYQTSRVAAKLAELHDAKVVLGTATPLVADYFTFLEKNLPIHRVTSLATGGAYVSETEIVSLKERSAFTKSKWLSDKMLLLVEKGLASGTQSLLFLNRRGSARIILCGSCGWNASCPNCDVGLTYHADKHRIQCHTCGYHSSAPSSCPVCLSTEITFKSVGTKAIAAELTKLYPQAKILRLDGDNLKAERLENNYEQIKSGEFQIIVGTQVISKGLDLPQLGLVGIIMADTGLNFPDYTAEERTFQLLSQVMGRANRGHRDTHIIIQTFNPESPTITYAASKNYEAFYDEQIKERKLFGFPPFKYILKLEVERASSRSAETAAFKLLETMQKHPGVTFSNPAPAFSEKVLNRYRWHIIVKSSHRSHLVDLIRKLPSKVSYDIDPTNLL